MEDASLDVVDQAILYHLQRAGRRSITDIADAVDMADNTVRSRIQSLEDAGVIAGYQANVNYDRADVQHHYMFVCTVRVSERERLAGEVRDLAGVVEVITLMTGNSNVYVLAAGSRKDDITDLAYAIDGLDLQIECEYLVRDHVRQPYSGFEPSEELAER